MYTRNPMTQLSRREFTTLTAAAAAAPFALGQAASAAALTAKELIDRITAQIGVPWKPDTVDGLKAGDPATVVTGVVTTAMATMAVLQQAVKAGANVVISSQPTFYARTDATDAAGAARPWWRSSRRSPAAALRGRGAGRSRVHRQERVHRSAQAGDRQAERSLAAARARPARGRPGAGDGLDEAPGRPAIRGATTCRP